MTRYIAARPSSGFDDIIPMKSEAPYLKNIFAR
jgi:hypothetical protein